MITYAGVDWVTMTSTKDGVGMKWYELYSKYRRTKLAEGDKEEPYNNGFYAGVGIASMRWGYSDRLGYIVIVSGGDAEHFWQNLEPGRARITRMDLCVDFTPATPGRLAKKLWNGLSEERRKELPGLSLFLGSQGGDTLYVGSRHSQQFGRLYDKGVEGKTALPGVHWRAEVEYKKPLAGLMAGELIQESRGQRVEAIVDTVKNWFFDRGVEVLPERTGREAIRISVEQRITTSDRKLAWLHSQVGPTVQKLVSLGLGREVLNSLLLDKEALSRILADET